MTVERNRRGRRDSRRRAEPPDRMQERLAAGARITAVGALVSGLVSYASNSLSIS